MSDIIKIHEKNRDLFFQQLSISLQDQDWSDKLIKNVEKKCDFLLNYHLVLFPGSINQIIDSFESWQDSKMLKMLSEEKVELKIREKIARALEIRIIKVVPKSIILKQNAILVLPSNMITGLQCYGRTSDIIWQYAGDQSDDFNYYTKRGLLLTTYVAARLFYLSDDSKNFIKTREFIKSSLNDIINIAKLKNKIKLPNIENIPILRMFMNYE